jgi:hypothetical protein
MPVFPDAIAYFGFSAFTGSWINSFRGHGSVFNAT